MQIVVAEVVSGDFWNGVVVGDDRAALSGYGVIVVVAVLRGRGSDGSR